MGTGLSTTEVDGCTGVPWYHQVWEGSYQCCVEHDLGGTDERLAECWLDIGMPAIIVTLSIAVMVMLRPLYHFWQWIERKVRSWRRIKEG